VKGKNMNQDKEFNELSKAFQGLVDSMSCTPVIYNEKGDPVWAGKPVKGMNAQAEVDIITAAKIKEYEKIGEKAFEDTEPLEDILRPGESRFV
jgi:hypothetical protein